MVTEQYDTKLRRKISKLYGKFGKLAPDIYQDYSRRQMQKVIFVMKEQLETPINSPEEMFDLIEHLPPKLQNGNKLGFKSSIKKIGKIKTVRQARMVSLGLSIPTKMPCYSYNLPAKFCILGSELAKQKGTICHDCYALKGWYKMKWVQDALNARLKAITHPDWEDAIIFDLIRLKQMFFRWHDSGDLQSIEHFNRIVNIAKRLPETKFWLATKQIDFVYRWWKENADRERLDVLIPNLVIRGSATHFDEKPPVRLAEKIGIKTSMVSVDCPTCPAHQQGNKCLSCRTCWNQKVFCVVYKKH